MLQCMRMSHLPSILDMALGNRIYKKISELSTLCGGEILFIIFSPTGKPYSFGHPFVETITKRILNPNQPLNEIAHASAKAYHKLVMERIEI
ncbi:hypothetical protein Gotur_036081 [Gossypium turneri]